MSSITPLSKKAGLNLDEADLVNELLASREGYKAFLKVVRKMVENSETDVIKMSSSEGAEKVFNAKLRAEGARKLFFELEQLQERK